MRFQCQGLSKRFGSVRAVNGIDLAIERGQIVAVVGHSGSGKTTFMRLIGGFERADTGTLSLNGTVVDGPGVHTPPEKRHVGIVFQEYALFPHMNVANNIAYGLPRERERDIRVGEVMELFGLAGMERRYPHQLSGGQQQRVAIARALAPSPRVILLDEPFSNLDAHLRRRLREEIKRIFRQSDVTALLVTHDIHDAIAMGDLVAVMLDGRIERIDSSEHLVNNLGNDPTTELLGIGQSSPSGDAVCPLCYGSGNHAAVPVPDIREVSQANHVNGMDQVDEGLVRTQKGIT